jgi:tetratricopeptide (TPR) repeat protein
MKNIFLTFLIFTSALLVNAQVDNAKLLDLMESQHYQEAASYLESLYPNGTDDPKIIHRLAYSYLMSGNLPKAEQNYQALLQKDPTSISVLNSLASIASKRGNLNTVMNFYQKIYDLDSLNFNVVKQMAYTYVKFGNGDKYKDYLTKANRLNPQDGDVASDLGLILTATKKYAKADSILDIALKGDSLNTVLWRGKLSIKYATKDFKEVIKIGEMIFSLADSTAEVENKVAQAYYYTKDYRKALELNKDIEGKKLANETTFYYIGLCYRKLDEIELSNDYLNKAVVDGISTNISIYYQELAANREMQKMYSISLYDYQKAQEYKEDNTVYYSIARIYDQYLKKPISALIYYQKFLKDANRNIKENQPYIDYCEARIKEIKDMK